jgi:hypothetical protein
MPFCSSFNQAEIYISRVESEWCVYARYFSFITCSSQQTHVYITTRVDGTMA